MAYLYRHLRNDTGNIFYIGIGSDEKFSRAKETSCRNKHWKNVVNKHGFTYEIMLTDLTWEEACKKEIEFIAFYGRKNLVNLTDGGQGTLGREVSESTRQIMRDKHKGRVFSEESKLKMRGRIVSQETRQKQSTSLKGQFVSEEKKQRLIEFNTGKTLSEEHKAKIRASCKGNNKGRKHTAQSIANMLAGRRGLK